MFRISRKYTQNIKLIREAHTYYDVLRLKPNCTQKEIRESFIKLSKEHHPDANLTLESTRKFQKILEAYQVLGKADTRGSYDAELRMTTPHSTTAPHSFYRDFNTPDAPGATRTNEDYYGLKGVKKVSNYVIVVLCLIFAGIGVALQILAIRSSMTFKREKLDLQSTETSHQHAQVKDDASKYGNELQLKRLRDKLKE
ncbi:dnaJ-like protein 60 [Phlebotomus papatasi]|uniref:dnaJ-like protein 60 n=1 Tax=Phlebotomus papatasi TaxID=29031 RepID=UPI002484714F|nr:dnaJ-like protein 60 [Phlebotomus papatasi]